jgi:hypothetical protein
LRKIGNFPDFNLGTQNTMWEFIYFYKIQAVILFYFGKISQPGNTKKALAASTKAFFSKTNGPLSPHYEEKNLKAPYLCNRLYIACHPNSA